MQDPILEFKLEAQDINLCANRIVQKRNAYNKQWRKDHRQEIRAYNKKCKLANPEKFRERKRRWRLSHLDKIRERNHRWYLKNRARVLDKNRQWLKNNPGRMHECFLKWYKNNPDKVKENRAKGRDALNEYLRKRYRTPRGHLNSLISGGIRLSLKNGKGLRHWECLVSYSVEDLRKHLESLFTNGMSWKNMGEWHIDHIVPISFFIYEKPEDQEFMYCWSLDNLQPLWGRENLVKSNKLNWRKA